jgi:hypothetical protein
MCAIWGGATASTASAAAVCADSVQNVGNFSERIGGACVNESIFRTKLYVVVESTSITKIAAGIGCAKTTETNAGNFNNATCTEEKKAGEGSFVKVVIQEGEAGAKWTVSGTEAGTLKAEVQLKELLKIKAEEAEATAILLSKVAGAKVWFLTHKTPELIGVKLEGEGKLTEGGKVKFTGVTTDLNEKASAVCTPLGTAGNDATLGTITSKEAKGALFLHEFKNEKGETVKEGVTQIKPVTGNVFATLFFGEECSLPAEVPVITKKESGKGLVLKEPKGTLGTEEVTHEITQNSLTEAWLISETEEHKATVDGTAVVSLVGVHLGLKWKGTPG